MNVLIVTGIFPPDHGGPASYVPVIASELIRQGHNVLNVVTLSDNTNHKKDYPFLVTRLARNQNKFLRVIKTISSIYSLAKGADIIYINGLVLESIIATKILLKRPVVIKVVGDLIWERATQKKYLTYNLDEFQKNKLSLKWSALRKLQAWYTSKADKIIVPSSYLAGVVSGWGIDTNKIVVIFNAVSFNIVHEPTCPFVDVVTVARLVPWKGVNMLIEVCAKNNWSLNIVGDGPDRRSLELLATKLNANVSFIGHVEKNQVIHEIRQAKVFVLNSSYEGLPHVVLEAKAAEVPVVATAVGGTPDTITHGLDGWLVNLGDELELTDTLRMILSNEKLRCDIAKTAKINLEKKFSFDEMVANTTRILLTASGR